MTARRILAGIALLLAACTTAACAQVVTGTGSVASDVQGGDGHQRRRPASAPTRSDSSSDVESSSASLAEQLGRRRLAMTTPARSARR